MATKIRKIQDWLKAEREWETCKGHHLYPAFTIFGTLIGVTRCQRCGKVARDVDKRVATGEEEA